MLINNLGHDHNFDNDKWDNSFRHNFSYLSTHNHKSSDHLPPPNSSSPVPPLSPPPSPPIHISSTSHLTNEFRILVIPAPPTFREIKSPDKYNYLPVKILPQAIGKELFQTLSNAYEKLRTLVDIL